MIFVGLRLKSPSRQLFLIGSLSLLQLCAGCPQPNVETVTKPKPPVKDFMLVASGDTHGWIMPCGCTSNQSGGLLRRASYVEQLRERQDVILVDVGGAADGVAPYQIEKFRAILEGENLMEITAHNVGAAELAVGAETLESIANSMDTPFVSTNVLTAQGKHHFNSYRHFTQNGHSLLILGVVSPRFSGPDFTVTDPADAIFQVLDSLEFEADWVVVLAYLNEGELRELAAKLPEAHAIIGGPTNQALAPEKIGPVLITSTTNKGKFLAELTFQGESESVAARVVEMSPEYSDNLKQKLNLDEFREILSVKDFTANQSGLVDDERWAISPTDQVAGTSSCLECHEQIHNEWEKSGHAHAWDRLVKEDAHFDSYCQQCHTTGYGWSQGFESANRSPQLVNVGCESCHGPSLKHVNNNSVKTPFDAQGQCIKCHDPENSPTFEFDSYWEKIHHE